jgi:hypothetical protein
VIARISFTVRIDNQVAVSSTGVKALEDTWGLSPAAKSQLRSFPPEALYYILRTAPALRELEAKGHVEVTASDRELL